MVSGVARICYEEGQSWKLVHWALTVDFRAGCSSCSTTISFVTNAVLIKSCELLTSASANLADYTEYLDSWLSDLLQSELKIRLLEVEGARAPFSHSWRRHWSWRFIALALPIFRRRPSRYFFLNCRTEWTKRHQSRGDIALTNSVLDFWQTVLFRN